MSINEFFYKHPVFRIEELAAWKSGRGADNAHALNVQLQHHLKMGRIGRIRRGVYAVIPPGESAAEFPIDPYSIAAKLTDDATIAYHSALELHGVAYSVFNQFQFLTEHKFKPFEFQGGSFSSACIPVALSSANGSFIETESLDREGVDIRVTNLARTFVDVIDRVELSGGWEEVVRSINNISAVDIDQIIYYCLQLNNAILSAKIGYFLELRTGFFSPEKYQINQLLKVKPKSPQYLSKTRNEPCQVNKKWNIMIPVSVINSLWEDPDYDV